MTSSPAPGSAFPVTRAWPYYVPALCLALAAIVFVATFWRGGSMELEALSFITYYTKDRPLLNKVFDPNVNDFGTFQARELSYFFDCLDATYFRFTGSRFAPAFFIPPSALVMPFLFALVFMAGVRRTARHLDALTATLLLGCFFSCFAFNSTTSLFYRSGKPLLALTVLALLFYLRYSQQSRAATPAPPRRFYHRDGVIAFLLAVTAGLLDLQGVFYVMTIAAILLLHFVLTRKLCDLVIALCSAALFLQLYNRWLGPRIIHALNNYWPDFGYQDIPKQEIPKQIVPAMHFLSSNVEVLLGGFLPMTLGGLAIFAFLALKNHLRQRAVSPTDVTASRFTGRGALYVGLALLANLVMVTLMVSRHPPVYHWPDHRHWYYPMPWLALVLFGVIVGTNVVLATGTRGERRVLQAMLAALVIGNLASLPLYRDRMIKGPWFSAVYPQSERLKTYMQTGDADPMMAHNFHELGVIVRGTHNLPTH